MEKFYVNIQKIKELSRKKQALFNIKNTLKLNIYLIFVYILLRFIDIVTILADLFYAIIKGTTLKKA